MKRHTLSCVESDANTLRFSQRHKLRYAQTQITHSGTLRHIQAHSDTLKLTQTQTDTLRHTQTHAGTLRHTQAHSDILRHIQAHSDTLTDRSTDTFKHSHTHTRSTVANTHESIPRISTLWCFNRVRTFGSFARGSRVTEISLDR